MTDGGKRKRGRPPGTMGRVAAMREEAVRHRRDGLELDEIGDRLGVSGERVRRLLLEVGISGPVNGLKGERAGHALEMARSGAGPGEVAAAFGVGIKRLRTVLRGLGFSFATPEPVFTPRDTEMLRLDGEGVPRKEIARLLGMSPSAVSNKLVALGRRRVREYVRSQAR